MKCPLKFSRYEFEGGTDCIGAECGFFGGVCGAANLIAERDELKAMNERLQVALDAVEGCDERCKKLEAERDEWKVKAEQAQESYLDAKADRDAWIEKFKQAELQSNDGISNLEWLYGYDMELAGYIDSYVADEGYGYAETLELAHKWLMEPHEEPHDFTQLKAQSKTKPNLSEQSESLSDDVDSKPTFEAPLYGWHEGEPDSREKLRIVMPRHNGEKYAKLMVKQFDQLINDELHDSREKLEADALSFANGFIRDHNGAISWNDELYQGIIKLLDRQAAIVEREWQESNDRLIDTMRTTSEQYREKIAELTEQLEAAHAKNRALKLHIGKMQAGRHGWHVKGVELQRQVDELTTQLHASNAERERLRECLGIATDQAHDLLNLVDESGNVYDRDEGLA